MGGGHGRGPAWFGLWSARAAGEAAAECVVSLNGEQRSFKMWQRSGSVGWWARRRTTSADLAPPSADRIYVKVSRSVEPRSGT